MSGGGSHTATKALGEDALKCVLVAFGSSLLRREPLLPPPPKIIFSKNTPHRE